MATCPTCRKQYPDDVKACADDGALLLPDAAFGGTDADLKPGDAVGEYRVEAKLGVGGFGTVYRAEHPVIGKKVAIKVLAREFSAKPEVSARFIDEARAANQIRHKGIIDIFAFGTLADGRHYFVMELLEGSSLEDHLRAHGPMQAQEALPILRGVARAVDAAHAVGIAHRDLKPDNVFLVRGDDAVHTKLLDFGIAKLLGNRSGQKTQTGTPIGTPHYMSPEQARGVNVGTRTDVYSFGVMTYQMLTGTLPFEGDVVMDILVKHMSETPPPPSSKNASLAPALDAPILHMLAKEPDARPPSLSAAVDELATAWSSVGGAPEAPTSLASVSAAPSARVVSQRTFVGATTEIAPAAPPQKRSAAAPYALAAAGVIAIAGAGLYFGVLKHTTTTPVVTAEARPPASTPASVAPPPVSAAQEADVMLTIDSTPAHVEVWDGDKKLGLAPGPFRLPRAAGTRKLAFKLAGYTSYESNVDLSTSGTLSVVLSPNARPASTKAQAAPTSSDLDIPKF